VAVVSDFNGGNVCWDSDVELGGRVEGRPGGRKYCGNERGAYKGDY
jgi:hypothetical protein